MLVALTPLAADTANPRLTDPGQVILVRHALAPGFGDPDNFSLDDCSTQRNLNNAGRAQAIAMGKWLRKHGVTKARVYTSQWCRCRETAELMALGPVTELPALNSFFQDRSKEDQRIQALRAFLAKQPVGKMPIVLVTHQVTITAVTGIFPSSGEGVILVLDGEGGFTVGPEMVFDPPSP